MNKCKICKKEHSRFHICDLDKQRKEELNQLEIPDNIDIDDLRLTDKLENRFNYE